LEARSSNGGVVIAQRETFIMYDVWKQVGREIEKVPEPVA